MIATPATPEPLPLSWDWRTSDKPPHWWDMAEVFFFSALVYAAMCAAMGLLTLAVITPVVLWRGEDWLAMAAHFLAPEMLWGALGISATMAAMPLCFAFMRRIIAFRFDAGTQQFTLVEQRAWFALQTRHWPLSAIVDITPAVMGDTGSTGGLMLNLATAPGKTRHLVLCEDLPRETVERHAQWLTAHLGTRVQAMQIWSD